MREAATSPARAAPTKRRPTSVMTRCRRRTGGAPPRRTRARRERSRRRRPRHGACLRVPRARSLADGAVARPPRPGRARRPAPRRRRAGFLRSPPFELGGLRRRCARSRRGGTCSDRSRRARVPACAARGSPRRRVSPCVDARARAAAPRARRAPPRGAVGVRPQPRRPTWPGPSRPAPGTEAPCCPYHWRMVRTRF